MPQPRRGDVWMVDFGTIAEATGGEIAKPRPAAVLSPDWVGESAAELVHVVPATSHDEDIISHVRVSPPEGGLARDSFFACEQLRVVSTDRLELERGPLGTLAGRTIEKLEYHVRRLLGLE